MNAIDLLKKDHEVVADLFEQVRNTPESKHSAIFTRIKAELDVHAHIEETVFYPRLKKNGNKELADITSEGIEEHHQIKMFLKELDSVRRQKDVFEAKLKVLMEDVEHHVDEEEGEMFSQVKDQFSESALEKLGVALENKKKKFIAANPAIARNVVKGNAAKKKSTLGTIYDKAVTAVEGIFTGTNKSARPASQATKKAGNGKTSPSPKAAGNGNGRPAKSRARTAAPAAKAAGAVKRPKASVSRTRGSGSRKRASAK